MTPDTKPVEGLGEATPPRSERKCLTCGEYHIAHRPDSGWAWQWSAGRKGHDEHPLRMESEADAFKARVERYEKALKAILKHQEIIGGSHFSELSNTARIAKEALAPPVGEKEKQ